MGMTAEEEIILGMGRIEGTLKGMQDAFDKKHEADIVRDKRIGSLERSRAYVWGAVAVVPTAIGVGIAYIFKSAGGDG